MVQRLVLDHRRGPLGDRERSSKDVSLLRMKSMKRRQASLFLRDQFNIVALRLRHNPVQARLITAHVTLCREDEVTDWDDLRSRLECLCPFEISLTFGQPVREDNFVYLPVHEGLADYQALRRTILPKVAREHIPHVTLIHPRNGTCTDKIFADISASLISPFQFTFREVMLIEQKDGGVWRVISQIG